MSRKSSLTINSLCHDARIILKGLILTRTDSHWQLVGGKATDCTALFRHFTKKDSYYTVETNGCVFICLYTGIASIDKEHMAWFRQQLERTKNARNVFVLGHYPVLKEFGGSVQGPEADEILAWLRWLE